MTNPVLAKVLRKSTIPMAYKVFATHRGLEPKVGLASTVEALQPQLVTRSGPK